MVCAVFVHWWCVLGDAVWCTMCGVVRGVVCGVVWCGVVLHVREHTHTRTHTLTHGAHGSIAGGVESLLRRGVGCEGGGCGYGVRCVEAAATAHVRRAKPSVDARTVRSKLQ